MMHGTTPKAEAMGLIAFIALLANVSVAMMLYAYRDGDANMQSVWLCSRNDAIGNIAVIIAALGVWGSNSAWPDGKPRRISSDASDKKGTIRIKSSAINCEHRPQSTASARSSVGQ